MFDPYVWTWFGGGKLAIVRQSHLDKVQSEQDEQRGGVKLLTPWAEALARRATQVDLLRMETVGEA